MIRESLDKAAHIEQKIDQMAEGNFGAHDVMNDLLKFYGDTGVRTILAMDDMNIRGTQIWVAFKHHCKNEYTALIEAVKNRDLAMIATVNKYARAGNHDDIAILRDASAMDSRPLLR